MKGGYRQQGGKFGVIICARSRGAREEFTSFSPRAATHPARPCHSSAALGSALSSGAITACLKKEGRAEKLKGTSNG